MLGGACHGYSCRRQQGGRKPSLLPSSEGGRGQVRYDRARCVAAEQGDAMAADSSTGNFGSLCCSLRRVDESGLGKVGSGMTGSGLATVADGSTGAFGLLCCSRKGVVMVRQVLVGYGKARSGHAWCGRVSGALRRPFKLKIQPAL